MDITSLRIRRLVTVVGVTAALLIGYGSIRAAAAWTASSAPLTLAPIPVSTIQDRLAGERARSADLQIQLETLATQSMRMSAALDAAEARIVSDTDHAKALAKELKDAKKKLARLEASIAKAKRAAQHQVVVTKTKTVTSSNAKHEDEDEDEHEDEHDD